MIASHITFKIIRMEDNLEKKKTRVTLSKWTLVA